MLLRPVLLTTAANAGTNQGRDYLNTIGHTNVSAKDNLSSIWRGVDAYETSVEFPKSRNFLFLDYFVLYDVNHNYLKTI